MAEGGGVVRDTGDVGSTGDMGRFSQQDARTCMAQECRYKHTHCTTAHRCGGCYEFGHGQIECGSTDLIARLAQYSEDRMPEEQYCDIDGCVHPFNHSKEAHHCGKCGVRATHGADACASANGGGHRPVVYIQSIKRVCPSCKQGFSSYIKIQPETIEDCIVCAESMPMYASIPCGHKICRDCIPKLEVVA